VVFFIPMTNQLMQESFDIFLMCYSRLCYSDKRPRKTIKMTNSVKQVNSLVKIWLLFSAIKQSASHSNICTYKKLHNYLHHFSVSN
jgi:hypothetical protein